MAERARVLIVDDSRIFRTAVEEALTGLDGIAVAGSVFSGEKALDFLRASPPDVVTLDVEMPGMDGIQTLEAIQRFNAQRPRGAEVGVIMVSAFTKRGADVTVRALQGGAFDFVTKPSGVDAAGNAAALRAQLASKIKLYLTSRKRPPALGERPESRSVDPRSRRVGERRTRAIVLAASTGGPKALEILLPDLLRRTDLPVFIVQHMPPTFTQSLAEQLGRQTGGSVVEARDGDVVRPKTAYIAPGGKHLLVRADGGGVVTRTNEQPPENGFRPSADVLFRSAAAVYGGEVVAVVLTGMACDSVADGTAGLRPLKRSGAYAIAQDEATSVVWGMPGSVVRAGLADEVVPLGRIAQAVQDVIGGRGAS